MKRKKFKKIMSLIDIADKRNDTLYSNGIDILNYCDEYHTIISLLGEEVFSEEGWDWVSYYLYEIPMLKDKKESYVTRADGSPVYLRNIDELYDYLKECDYV